MKTATIASDTSKVSIPAACIAIGAGVVLTVLLAALHILSPEFDPSWRVISEYANGQYGWVLSLMFAAGALSCWALAFAIRSQVKTRGGKIGLGFLVAAGVGPAMAAVFDISHPLHNLSGMIGTLSLPVAAILIGISLGRTQPWSVFRRQLLWAGYLTWLSLLLFIATMAVMIVTYTQSGAAMPPAGESLPIGAALPEGVVGINGWPNRLLIVVNGLVWPAIIALQAIKLAGRRSA
jgi:hypothetical membrane protein